jgi:hypothetical protein
MDTEIFLRNNYLKRIKKRRTAIDNAVLEIIEKKV